MHFAFDPGLGDSLSFDPERARNLLEAAGWSDRDGDGVRERVDGTPLEIGPFPFGGSISTGSSSFSPSPSFTSPIAWPGSAEGFRMWRWTFGEIG